MVVEDFLGVVMSKAEQEEIRHSTMKFHMLRSSKGASVDIGGAYIYNIIIYIYIRHCSSRFNQRPLKRCNAGIYIAILCTVLGTRLYVYPM